jgi:large subunit ribosomal protein L6
LSIPPEVTFNVLPPKMMTIGKHGRAQPMSVVEIKGPLGMKPLWRNGGQY